MKQKANKEEFALPSGKGSATLNFDTREIGILHQFKNARQTIVRAMFPDDMPKMPNWLKIAKNQPTSTLDDEIVSVVQYLRDLRYARALMVRRVAYWQRRQIIQEVDFEPLPISVAESIIGPEHPMPLTVEDLSLCFPPKDFKFILGKTYICHDGFTGRAELVTDEDREEFEWDNSDDCLIKLVASFPDKIIGEKKFRSFTEDGYFEPSRSLNAANIKFRASMDVIQEENMPPPWCDLKPMQVVRLWDGTAQPVMIAPEFIKGFDFYVLDESGDSVYLTKDGFSNQEKTASVQNVNCICTDWPVAREQPYLMPPWGLVMAMGNFYKIWDGTTSKSTPTNNEDHPFGLLDKHGDTINVDVNGFYQFDKSASCLNVKCLGEEEEDIRYQMPPIGLKMTMGAWYRLWDNSVSMAQGSKNETYPFTLTESEGKYVMVDCSGFYHDDDSPTIFNVKEQVADVGEVYLMPPVGLNIAVGVKYRLWNNLVFMAVEFDPAKPTHEFSLINVDSARGNELESFSRDGFYPNDKRASLNNIRNEIID